MPFLALWIPWTNMSSVFPHLRFTIYASKLPRFFLALCNDHINMVLESTVKSPHLFYFSRKCLGRRCDLNQEYFSNFLAEFCELEFWEHMTWLEQLPSLDHEVVSLSQLLPNPWRLQLRQLIMSGGAPPEACRKVTRTTFLPKAIIFLRSLIPRWDVTLPKW